MASAYSTPKQFDNYVEPVNLELVNFVLGSKEQKFNYNIAKVEQTLQDFGQLGLVRDKDKEYLSDRVNTMLTQMGDITNADWSDSNIERQISSGIRGSMDEKVRNDIKMSNIFTSFQKEVSNIREDDKESYSDANVNYALQTSGAMDWYKGKSEGFDNLTYNPFVDVSAKQREILDETINMKRGITREVVDPSDGTRYIETETYGLTPTEIRNKVTQNLTPQETKQLEINAWNKYGGGDVKKIYEEYSAPKLKALSDKRDTLKLNYEGKSDAQKAIINKDVKTIDYQISQVQSIKDNKSAILTHLGTEELLGGLSSLYAPVETSFKYNDNPAARRAIEQAADNAALLGSGNLDANNNTQDDVTTVSNLTGNEEENPDVIKNADREIENYKSDLNLTFRKAYNRLDTTAKTAFDKGYNEYISENELDDNGANKTTFMLENSNNGMGDYFTPQEVVIASRLIGKYETRLGDRTENLNEAMQEKEDILVQEIFSGVKSGNDTNIEMLDESDNVVSMVDYLSGYDSLEDLPEEKRNTLFKSVYADMTLSQTKDYNIEGGVNANTNYNIARIAKIEGELDRKLPSLLNPSDILSSEYSKQRFDNDFKGLKKDMQIPEGVTKEQFKKQILPIIKSDFTFRDDNSFGLNDVLNADESIPYLGGAMKSIRQVAAKVYTNATRAIGARAIQDNIIIGGEGTKTRAALEKAMTKGTYDKFSFLDDSVEDDGDLIKALNNRAAFEKSYGAKMAEDASNYAQNNAIIVEPSGARVGEEVPAFGNLVNTSKGMLSRKAGNLIVTENETGDYYNVTQQDIKVVNGEEESETRSADIAKVDLQGGDFMDWVNLTSEKDRINTSNTKSLTSGKVTFANGQEHRKYIVGLGKMIGATDESQLAKFTAEGAKKSILKSHPKLFNNPQVGQAYKKLANNMIDNSHLFRINVTANDFDRYDMAIQYQTKKEGKMTWKNLRVLPTRQNDMTDAVPMMDAAPQMFLYDYMDKLFTDIGTEGAEYATEDLKTLNKIFPQ